MTDLFVVLPKDYETKMKIITGVDRPLQDLTVDAICRASGVSRPTFYRHFESKYDLSYWYAGFCEQLTLDKIGRTLTWREALQKHFELLSQEKNLFYCSSFNPQKEELQKKKRLKRVQTLLTTLHECHGIENDATFRFYAEAYALVEAATAAEWFSTSMEAPPDQMAELLEACVPEPLHRMLAVPCPAENRPLPGI